MRGRAAALALLLGGCTPASGGDTPGSAPSATSAVVAPAPPPAPPPSPAPPASPAPIANDPAAVVRAYVDAIAARRFRDARLLWEGHGDASGVSEQAFADAFGRYRSFDATVGPPGRIDAGAGQRYVTVPVRVTGTLDSGGPFALEGPVTLHKAANGIATDDPEDHLWRIRDSAIRPRP